MKGTLPTKFSFVLIRHPYNCEIAPLAFFNIISDRVRRKHYMELIVKSSMKGTFLTKLSFVSTRHPYSSGAALLSCFNIKSE